jgi:NADH dehydrogenase
MRDLVAGALAGLLCAVPVMAAQETFLSWYGLYGAAAGVAVAMVTGHRRENVAVVVAGGLLVGVLGWLLVPLTLEPLVRGHFPTWTADAIELAYPDLVADVLHGGLAGLVLSFVPVGRRARARREPTRIVIVGGGFGGVSAAQRLERLAVRGAPVDVTLISDSNFLLFTPMLAEVASGAVAATHISAPVRSALSHTRFRNGRVLKFDTGAGSVQLRDELIPYDHLVLAVGSVPHSFDLPGVAEHAWTLKSLTDATRLRNHVLGLLERADSEPSPDQRRRMLTFVVAGAGFAGTELIAELFDLVHGVRHYFPGIAADDPSFVLVHPGPRILPEMPAALAGYALERLQARGIECRLGVRVAEATAEWVRLTNGDRVWTSTFVWTAGNRPGDLAGAKALETDSRLRVTGMEYVLLGALTAMLYAWLDALARRLFVDDVRMFPVEAPGTRAFRAIRSGALAGLTGGVLFTAVMVAVGALPTVARMVGSTNPVVGLIVHLVIAQIIGVSYAVLFRRKSFDVVSGVGWGLCYGFFWWVLGNLTLLPWFTGSPVWWDAAALSAGLPSLVGHLAYGAALGAVYFRLEARTNPWWMTRNDAEKARVEARREQTLSSAPALWTLTVFVALTVPVLVSP